MEEHRHNDSHQHRIDKQNGRRDTRIHIIITLEQEQRREREQQPHHRQRQYIRLFQSEGLFLYFHQNAQHHNSKKITVEQDGIRIHPRPIQG